MSYYQNCFENFDELTSSHAEALLTKRMSELESRISEFESKMEEMVNARRAAAPKISTIELALETLNVKWSDAQLKIVCLEKALETARQENGTNNLEVMRTQMKELTIKLGAMELAFKNQEWAATFKPGSSPIEGTFEMTVSSPNYENFVKATGIYGFCTTIVIAMGKPTITISQCGYQKYKMETKAKLSTTQVEFSLGQEIVMEKPSFEGKPIYTRFDLDGTNKLIQVSRYDGRTSTITRTFSENEFIAVFEAGGIQAVRVYKRVQKTQSQSQQTPVTPQNRPNKCQIV